MNFRKISFYFFALIILIVLQGCKCKEKAVQTSEPEIELVKVEVGGTIIPAALQPTLVYKTNKDYSRNIPVIMNAEKTDIISYPAPSDVYFRGTLAYPTQLEDGYLLDNRGIGPNVAFLDYTYEIYATLKQAPDKETLLKRIIDKNPLMELWDCGPRNQGSNEIRDLNILIGKKFPDCRQLINVYKATFEP